MFVFEALSFRNKEPILRKSLFQVKTTQAASLDSVEAEIFDIICEFESFEESIQTEITNSRYDYKARRGGMPPF